MNTLNDWKNFPRLGYSTLSEHVVVSWNFDPNKMIKMNVLPDYLYEQWMKGGNKHPNPNFITTSLNKLLSKMKLTKRYDHKENAGAFVEAIKIVFDCQGMRPGQFPRTPADLKEFYETKILEKSLKVRTGQGQNYTASLNLERLLAARTRFGLEEGKVINFTKSLGHETISEAQ